MAAIIRVKRRNNDETSDALLIACKRRKTDESEKTEDSTAEAPITTVVKFVGTITKKEENVIEHLTKTLSKEDLKKNFKQHVVNPINKSREKVKQNSIESRYKVISCFRSLDIANLEEFDEKVMTVVDVEDSISCSVTKGSNTNESESYVYDLYYAQTEDNIIIDNSISVHNFDQEFVYDTYKEDCFEYDSDDSNSESNWRNDYPDTDYSDDSSINEDDIRKAMVDLNSDAEGYLSSDDDFVYAVDEKDVEQFGFKYAIYKARMKEELSKDDSNLNEFSGLSISEEPEEQSESDYNE